MVGIKCLFEGVINMQLKNKEFGEQCLNECLARCENQKILVGKYAQPSALYELACFYADAKEFTHAKANLAKAQSFKDYELDNRIQIQIRSLQRKIKYLTELKSSSSDNAHRASSNGNVNDDASKHEAIQKQNNFFLS